MSPTPFAAILTLGRVAAGGVGGGCSSNGDGDGDGGGSYRGTSEPRLRESKLWNSTNLGQSTKT